VLDTHLAYTPLAYFRSSHDNDSWISSLGAVMDAATLVLTTLEMDDGNESPGGPLLTRRARGWAAPAPRCWQPKVWPLSSMRAIRRG